MKLELPNGHVQIDDEDYPLVAGHNWRVQSRNGGGLHYVIERLPTQSLLMHRLLMGLNFGDKRQVDHINHDGLDNRRSNLRLATPSQNLANGRPRCGYKGVSRARDRWRAYIRVNGRQYRIGTFDTPEEAARAYDAAAVERFGDFALLNFGGSHAA